MKFGDFRPDSIKGYRDSTERHKPLAGVWYPSFRCKKCNQPKLVKGRQKLPGEGYACADCVTKETNNDRA